MTGANLAEEPENYKLSSLVLDMNYGNVWNIINDLKDKKITNKNCNINSEKFKMIPELFEKIKITQHPNKPTVPEETKSVSSYVNKIYRHKLDYSDHVKDVKINTVIDGNDDNLAVVTFKKVKFFKIEDLSRTSYFEYDLPPIVVNKAQLMQGNSEGSALDVELKRVLKEQIVPKFDAIYTLLNFGSYNPSFKQYFGAIVNGCEQYLNSKEEDYFDYTHITSKFKAEYKDLDENDYSEMLISQPYASTRIRLINQFQDCYSWPFENVDDCLQFFTKFILEDLQSAMEKYDDPTARTYVSNRFYESLESRLTGLSLNETDTEDVTNLKKYLRFLRTCGKFKRDEDEDYDQNNSYDPIIDFVYCLWGHIKSIFPVFFRLASSCYDTHDKSKCLLDYFGYHLSFRNDELENVNSHRRTLLIALQNFPSLDLNIAMYDDYSNSSLESLFGNMLTIDLTKTLSFSLCLKKLKESSFTERLKKPYKELFDKNFHSTFGYSENAWEEYLDDFNYDINSVLKGYTELQFSNDSRSHLHLEFTNQLLAKREFSTIAFASGDDGEGSADLNLSASKDSIDFWQYFNKSEAELKNIESLLTDSSPVLESKKSALEKQLEEIDSENVHSLIEMVHDMKECEVAILHKFLYEKNVMFSPIQNDSNANIFKENRIFLEHIDVRPYFYQLVAREFFNSEGNIFDPLKDKIIQVILAFADPYGRPVAQSDKIMSIDYLSELMIGFVSELISGNVDLSIRDQEGRKIKIASLFTNLIKFSLTQLNMDRMNYQWLNIAESKSWIEKTNDLFDFKYTTRSIELAYNANILMSYSIWKLTKDLSVCSFTPAAELFSWAWSSCNMNLQVYLKIDQIEESFGSKTSFTTINNKISSPYLLKTLTMLSSGWRYVLATILNQKCDDPSIKHEFNHLSFNQFMSPSNRKFSSGALSSTSIELLENTLNVMIKRHFIDFNKKDELVLQKHFFNTSRTNGNDLTSDTIELKDFFQNKDKTKSYFEKIEIVPDDDLDDDVQYVFRDSFIEEDDFLQGESNSFVDPTQPNKKFFFDYRDPERYFGEQNNEMEDDLNVDSHDEYGLKNDSYLVCNKVSATEEFLYRTEIARCTCSVTKAFIKKREHLDLSKQLDPTHDSLVFVDSTSEFCPSELLNLFAPFIAYPYLTDNQYNFDTLFPFKPITDINFRKFIERFLSMDKLGMRDKMQMLSEIASINFHFNDVFERGVVFSEDDLLDNPELKKTKPQKIETVDGDGQFADKDQTSVTNDMGKFNTRKGFFEHDIDEVKACFNLRGELLQMLLKMDNSLFKYMETDYYFVERVLDELLADKFYMCWINCLFTLMKIETEEDFYNDRYFCLYAFKLISRSIGPISEDSMFEDCFLIKGQKKFDYLKKSFYENTVLPDIDHAFFYFSFLVERTANFLNKVGGDVSAETLSLITFYTEFFVNQLQGLYFCLLSVSQCGFDLPGSKEFFNVSCLNNKFLLHLSEQGCVGGFPYNKKDLNAVKDFFRTTDYIIKCVSWLINNDKNNQAKFGKMKESLIFLIMEFSYYFEEDKRDFKVNISNKFKDMVLKSQYDFSKYQLGTFMYTKAIQNQIIGNPIWKKDDYFPVDVFKVYNMFYETSKLFSNMNMNTLIQNNMAFKHSIDHGLDLTEKSGNESTVSRYGAAGLTSNGFIYKEDVLRV